MKIGWSLLLKKELSAILKPADFIKYPKLLHEHIFVRRLNYWIEEGGDVSDARLVFLIEKFMVTCAPQFLARYFEDVEPTEIGRSLGVFFSVPEPQRASLIQQRNIQMHLAGGGEQVTAGVFQLASEEGENTPDEYHVFNQAYLRISASENSLFHQADLIKLRSPSDATDNEIIARRSGYLIPFARYPLLLMKSPDTYPNIDMRELRIFRPPSKNRAGGPYAGSLCPLGSTRSARVRVGDNKDQHLYDMFKVVELPLALNTILDAIHVGS